MYFFENLSLLFTKSKNKRVIWLILANEGQNTNKQKFIDDQLVLNAMPPNFKGCTTAWRHIRNLGDLDARSLQNQWSIYTVYTVTNSYVILINFTPAISGGVQLIFSWGRVCLWSFKSTFLLLNFQVFFSFFSFF